jgi:hypothetical protein
MAASQLPVESPLGPTKHLGHDEGVTDRLGRPEKAEDIDG